MKRGKFFLFTGLSILLLFISACQKKNAPIITDAAYVQEINAWHAQREANLKKEKGWLNLVGLHWLKEGDNTFGSDSSNQLIFPPQAPPFAGIFTLQKGVITLTVKKDVIITADGKTISSSVLKDDSDSLMTRLAMGSFRFYVIKRNGEYAIRLKDLESPLLKSFQGIDRYTVDKNWQTHATIKKYDPMKIILIPTILGTVDSMKCPGLLTFTIDDQTYTLEPVLEDGSDDLFIIFGDRTNGSETYGGGRFLYTKMPAQGDSVIVDFNKAYNPPCVFTDYATCPLPPLQNKLPIPIKAGEKMWGHKKH